MSDIKSILINMALLGVLVFGIMAFVLTLQVDNNLDVDKRITNNTLMNDSYGELETILEESQSKAQTSSDSFGEVPPTEYVGDLDVGSTISATTTAKGIVIGLWSIYIKLPIVFLGVSPIISSVITTILLILIIIGVWAIWKGAIQ